MGLGVGDGVVGVGVGLVGLGDVGLGDGDGVLGVGVGVDRWGRTMCPTVVPRAGESVNSEDSGRPVTSSKPVTTAIANTKTSTETEAIRPQW